MALPSTGVFKKNIIGRKVAEFEIYFFLSIIFLQIEIFVQVAIAVSIGSGQIVGGSIGGGKLVDVDKTPDQFISGVNFKHTVGSGPVLDRSSQLILGFLGATDEEPEKKRQ
jgi:hypothetical protein